MQVKRLAAALVALAPLYAAAQTNVTLYGVVDAAIESADQGGSIGRHTNVQSGNQSGSRFGFRGAEDLGNGLKAIFNLEAGVAVDTGAQDSALFQRRAVVGLESDFGTLTLGREYSPLAQVAGASDEFGQGFYGNNLSAFEANQPYTPATRRLSNSINFKSASFGGVDVMAAYSAGEKTGPSNNLIGWGAEYKQGGLYVGGAYHTVKAAVAGDTKEYGLGAGYTFAELGGFEIKGNYIAVDPIGDNNTFKQYNVGVGYPFGASKVYANLQQDKLAGAKGTAWALAYSYTLSKRTNLYAAYASMNNNASGAFILKSGANAVKPATAGTDPSVFTVGVRHTF